MHPIEQLADRSVRLRFLLLSCFSLFAITVLQAQPVITAVAPDKGPVGTTVVLTGTGFSTTQADNVVYFGPVRAIVQAASATSLTVTVPAGASGKRITVTVNQRTAWSARPFLVTFTGGEHFDYGFWGTRIDTTTGLYPIAVAIADLDGDGKPDLVTTNNANVPNSSISLLLNTGTVGTIAFAPRKDVVVPDMPRDVVAADFDGDGKLDLAVSSITGHGTLQVFRNESTTGSLKLAAPVGLAAGENPYAMVVGDIDGDGRPDIVTANYLASTISVLRNTTTGTNISFSKTDIFTGIGPADIELGDLDNDGKPDIVVSHELGNNITVVKNNSTAGTVSLQVLPAINSGKAPRGVVVGDLDGDGLADIACVESGDKKLAMFRNTTSGSTISFAAAVSWGMIGADNGTPYNVKMDDMTGDGKADLLVAGPGATVLLYRNISTSGNLNLSTNFHVNSFAPYELATGDLDGDGKPDLAAVNFTFSNVSLWRNQGNEPFVYSFAPTAAPAGTAITIEGARFNNATAVAFGGVPATSFTIVSDQQIKAVVGTGNSGAVSVTGPGGTGKKNGFEFAAPPAIQSFTPQIGGKDTVVTITGTNFTHVTAVHIGGVAAAAYTVVSPTTIRAVVGTGASGTITVVTDFGSHSYGSFTYYQQPVITSFTPEVGAQGTTITINGQYLSGTHMLRVGGYPVASFQVLSNTQVTAVLADGGFGDVQLTTPGGKVSKGIFRFAPVTVQSFTPASGPAGTVIQITGQHFSTVPDSNRVYFGEIPGKVLSASNNTLSVVVPAAATLGPLKIIAHGTTGYSRSPFNQTYNNAQAGITGQTFAWKGAFATQGDPMYTTMADLDGDGRPDFVTSSNFYKGLAYIRNTSADGRISFSDPVRLINDLGYSAPKVLTGDLDSDGKPEIILINSTIFYVLKNISTASGIAFAPPVSYAAKIGVHSSQVYDIDGDGREDIVFMTFSGSQRVVNILRNTGSDGKIDFAAEQTIASAGEEGSALFVADLDQDGKPDLLVRKENSVQAFRNMSTPGNCSFTAGADRGVMQGSFYNLTTDVTNDGLPDLVIFGDKEMIVYKNTSQGGTINFAAAVRTAMPDNASGSLVGQLDGDGIPDLGVLPAVGKITTIYPNQTNTGSIKWGAGVDFQTKVTYNWVSSVMVGDVDGDGKPDMIVANNPDGKLSVMRNQAGEALVTRCANELLLLQAPDGGSTYQWQVNDGSGFSNLSDDALYQGTRTKTLVVPVLPYTWDGYVYRCIVDGKPGVQSNLVVNAVRPEGNLSVQQDNVCAGGFIRVELSTSTSFPVDTKAELMESINDGPYKVVDTRTTKYGFYFNYTIDQVAGPRKFYYRLTPVAGTACPIITETNVDVINVVKAEVPLVTMDGQSMKVTNVENNAEYIWVKVVNGADQEVFRAQGAAGATYATRESGTYKVLVTQNGCQVWSANLNYVFTALTAVDGARVGMRAYPVPAAAFLYIDTLRLADGWETLQIIGPDGKRQLPVLSIAGRTRVSVPVAGLKPGLYYVVLYRNRKAPVILKFMKG